MTTIANNAFYNCKSLTSVTFENTSGWKIYSSSSSTTGYAINVSTPATNATNLKNSKVGSVSSSATNWGNFYLKCSDD